MASTLAKRELLSQLLAMETAQPTNHNSNSKDALPLIYRKIGKKTTEHFLVIALNAAHRIIGSFVVTKGLVNRTLVHPREVFRGAITCLTCL